MHTHVNKIKASQKKGLPLHLFAHVCLLAAQIIKLNKLLSLQIIKCKVNFSSFDRTEAQGRGIDGQRGNEMVCISLLAGGDVCKCAYVAL